MNLNKVNFEEAISEVLLNFKYDESISIGYKYDSAIVGVNFITDSVIYSLNRLINIEIESMENLGFPKDSLDRNAMYNVCLDYFFDIFHKLELMDLHIPPTLLFDVENDTKLVA